MNDLEPPPRGINIFSTQWRDWLFNVWKWIKGNMNKNFFFEVSQGNVTGYTAVTKFGYNDDIDTAEEDVWSAGGSLTYLTTASTFRIQAGGNAADTAAGTGAQEVTIQYIDSNYDIQEETVATAGASASSATSTSGWAVLRAYVGAVGSSGSNVGDITIEAVTGGTTQGHIPATKGQTQQLFYIVPQGKTAYVLGGRFSVVKGSGGGGVPGSGTAGIHFYGWVRSYDTGSTNNYGAWRQVFDETVTESGGNPTELWELVSDPIPEKSHIRVSADSDTSNMHASGRLYIVLKDN